MPRRRPPDILDVMGRHQAALERLGRSTSSRLVAEYGRAWKSISGNLDALTAKIDAARAAGETVDPAWLAREARYRALLDQVETQVGQFSKVAFETVRASQVEAVTAAEAHATQVVRAGGAQRGIEVSFDRLPVQTVNNILATTGPRSPLQKVFATLGNGARQDAATSLVSGVISGKSPRAIAADLRRVTGGPLSRSLTIARTETLRAYREASRQTYQKHGDIVAGWTWYATRDRRGCAACWAQHGSVHPLSEPLAAHPNCRCAMLPNVPGWTPAITDGATEFANLPASDQARMLGPSKFRAYQAGSVSLTDLVRHTHSPVWGVTASEQSLAGALGSTEAAARFYRPAP